MWLLKQYVKRTLPLLLVALNTIAGYSQLHFSENTYSPVLDSLMKVNPDFFSKYYNFSDYYRIQIIYTQIDRDENGNPTFTNHTWRLKPDEYFNPASFVKVPASIFAMEKVNNELSKYGVTKYSPMYFEKNTECETEQRWDSTCVCLYPNVAHFIKRALIVSENSPYKRLYELLGQEYIQKRLDQLGMSGSKIIQRFASDCDEEGNRFTNAVNFFDVDSVVLYRQPEQYNPNYAHVKDSTIMIGKYHMDGRKKLKGGKDFSNANWLQLHHIHQLMMAIFFPKQMPKKLQFNLTSDDLDLIRRALGINPEESTDPLYNRKDYWSAYNNYFFYGQSKSANINPHLRIFNKVAMAFGFLSETAYVVDFKNKKEFFLSATIYVNKDETMLDNKYDYADVGMPFLQTLSYIIYKHELKRKTKYSPDFSELQRLFPK
jgi:hypothetical protein